MRGDEVILDSTPTTTGQKFSPQKYRGHTLEILGVLSECGGLTTCEIADKTGLKPNDVWQYCRRGFSSGIIERKERWGWSVSPLGLLILSIKTTTTTTNDTTTTQQRHKHDTNTTPKVQQLNLSAFTGREDMDETDRVVVGVLVSHYERTGKVFRHFDDEYEIGRVMGIASQDVKHTLRHLRDEGCIYFRREALGWKLGLMKDFVWRLQNV
jgi:predicted transcriptional regulator